MTNNERLALWQGWVLADAETNLWDHPVHGDIWFDFPKDYKNDDAAAMSLLDALVEKGFDVRLQSFLEDPASDRWQCTIWQIPDEVKGFTSECVSDVYKPTHREAVVAAVLELIGKEDV